MSGRWRRLAGGKTGRWSVWKFNWLINHRIAGALRAARGHARGDLLDVGCGERPFAGLFAGQVTRYLGTDLAASPYLGSRRPDVYARAETLPFRDASFDTVLGLSMLTYLPEPGAMLAEAHRVLRPGGVLILEFTQMAPLHDEPHDYLRFTRFGAAHLLAGAGFEPIEFLSLGGLARRVGLSILTALNRLNRGPTRVLTELPVRLLYIVVQVAADLADRLLFDPQEAIAHLVVARRAPRPSTSPSGG